MDLVTQTSHLQRPSSSPNKKIFSSAKSIWWYSMMTGNTVGSKSAWFGSLNKKFLLVLEEGLPMPRQKSWIIAQPDEEHKVRKLVWENLGVDWGEPFQLCPGKKTAILTAEWDTCPYLTRRTDKTTWNLPVKTIPGLGSSTDKFYKAFKK